MRMKKRSVVLLVTALTVLILALLGYSLLRMINASETINQFRSFSVTINNQSDYDITSVEFGIIDKNSKSFHTETIESGGTNRIKPDLSLSGEGAIYMKISDSSGKTREETVCGYTESLSGFSKVTVSNDHVAVEGKCM